MAASIDLRKAHLSRFHGDLMAVYSWIDDERALFLIPHLRKGAPWYIVKESAAYKYDDPKYMARQCAVACDVLGMEPSRPNWVRVASIIHEGLPDLVSMPSAPLPEFHKASYGQVLLREDGKAIGGEEIRLPVEGASYG
jgi:hypothetical protein